MPTLQGMSPGAHVDLFLKVVSSRSGPIKGEATDQGANGSHAEEILIDAWGWGAAAPPSSSRASGGARVSSARQLKNLKIYKQLDSASLGLAKALVNNEDLREVKLTARKAGGTQLEFLLIVLRRARVVSFEIECGQDGGTGTREVFEFGYREIELTYTPQGPDGQPRGQIMQSFDVPSGDF